MTRRVFLRHLFLLTGLVFLGLPRAAAADVAAIVQQGNGKGAAPCVACHGIDGGGQVAAGYPRLAGLDAGYLRKQLDDFTSGSRANLHTRAHGRQRDESERQGLAEYYAKLPIPVALAKTATPPSAADSIGAVLATRGDWSRDVPGCTQCHGPGGSGVGAGFPPLAGQPAAYIAAQIKAWQQGTRHNDPLQLMQHLSSALRPPEIEAVANWFAAQPLTATPKGTP